tara:strand:+ start:1060 stop:3027 length:1968 start_codon:yes stop_codon:yes gene_type:complete
MIFDQLTIDNYGVYKGKQEFNLSVEKKKPVIIIGAMNGSGKTTFLNAVDLVLYGKFSNIFKSQSLSYENFLKKNINNQNYDQETSIELIFHRKLKGKKQNFKISRAWKQNGTSKIKEMFHVFIDDVYDEDITKDWENFVDQILPTQVASLFFFDGEKIEQLADLDASKEVLKKAINSLLGLEIIDRLNLDLEEFRKRSVLQLKTDKEQAQIQDVSKELKTLDKDIETLKQKIVKIEDELTKVNYEIKQLDVELSQKGIAYYNKRKEYEINAKEKEIEISDLKQKLIDIAADNSPFLLIEKELKEILNLSKKNDTYYERVKEQKVTNKLIGSIENFSKENCNDKNFLNKFNKFLKDKTINQEHNLESIHLFQNLKSEQIDFLINTELKKNREIIEKLLYQFDSTTENFEKINMIINKIPGDEQITPLIEKQKELKKKTLILQTKINVVGNEISPLNNLKVQKNILLKQLLNAKINQDLENLDKHRYVEYSDKIKQIINQFQVRALNYHVKKLEKFIFDCFKTLLRKKNLVKKIKIDTNNYELKIYDKKGYEINSENLSAGERQLLAVAILWGLTKASTSVAPTIIDTPLGRLDSTHRTNIVEQYFPQASKQVILLSTDEEINERYLKKINPYLSRSYLVEYDHNKNGSKIQEGYFF